MGTLIEFQPNEKSLVVFDGTVLEVYGLSDAARVHVKGLDGFEIVEGMGRRLMIKNRFGPDYGLSYDKDRLPELREFVARVEGAAGLPASH